MTHLFFKIFFTYDIKSTTIQVDLCAAIEMTDDSNCIVRDIRRIDTDESPWLPQLPLTGSNGVWILPNTGKESNISTAIGEAIDLHLKELSKTRDEMKNK